MVATPTSTPGEMWVSDNMMIIGFDPITFFPIFALVGYYINGDVDGDGVADLLIQTTLGLDSTHIIG
jgi:hypothetical protein